MSEHREFKVREIVWASVEQYPPWPAKIVRKQSQNGKTVYKVNFFGDPTYSYLHSNSLSPFNRFETAEIENLQQNLKFKRAFELAKFSISKQYDQISNINNQFSLKTTQLLNLPVALEQTCIQSKDDIDLPQKTPSLSRSSTPQTCVDGFSLDQISPSNVVQLLDSYQKGQIAQRLGNLKRKQIICFQNQLKQNLLLKYKLHAVDFLKETPKPQQAVSNSIFDLRTVRKEKKKTHQPKFDQKELCLRKIQKILYQKGMERHTTYATSLKIVKQIERRSEGMKSGASNCFKQSLIRIMHQISSNMQQIQQVECEYLQKHLYSFIDLEFHSHKLEQGSRMTQICEEFGV